MNSIISELIKTEKFKDLNNKIKDINSPIVISGLTCVGMNQIISGLSANNKKPILIISYNEIQAKRIYQNLKTFEPEKVVYFPRKEIVTYDYLVESKDLPYERIEALNKIYQDKNIIVVTTIEAVMQKLPSKDILYSNNLDFKVGDVTDLETIKNKLVNLGYIRSDLVEGRGQFSVRGGIVDVSINEKSGVRIELWGDEVDSIRSFNISSQRSVSTLEKTKIYPAHEFVLAEPIEKICSKLREKNVEGKQIESLNKDIEQIKNGGYISKVDKYFESFYEKNENILDYINSDCYLIFDELDKVEQRQKSIIVDINNLRKALLEKEKIVPEAYETMMDYDIDNSIKNHHTICMEIMDNNIKNNRNNVIFKYRELNYFKSELESFFKDIKKWLYEKKNVYILVSTVEKAKKMKDILEKEDILTIVQEKLTDNIILKSSEGIAIISTGNITEGFENYDTNQIVINADELIDGGKKKKSISNKFFKEGEKIVFADLKEGDYVVHKNYGVGIFVGVNTITADDTTKDYIKLKYKDNDILYIPTNQLDYIRKYIGGDAIKPPINSIGSKDWAKTKEKVKKNLRAVARDLIELYAKREKARGFAFSKDTPWQQQFEDKFPYQETDDQLRCIEEVKIDMEKQKPMDRLLCGDVGYGKTEVAIRAAFKAVMDQKQVAYLVPTTVLAQQQYEEFKDRMKDFPIRVEILNRFKSKKYQDEVIKKLKLGEVDVVIGTHRLLSQDVEFKDLGLLIIDEEHRFGVKAKEKIKKYKSNVDVLTMTATPIPRTMHMSIVGIRDMSVIYEPPQIRKQVQSYVLEYDKEVIKEAIIRELERNGQVFYIFNNVENIQLKADEISRLVPEANVSYAHGRMTGTQIEVIMKDFIEGKSNVLVCTTILESGIDIPNANTIIVENADKMGLAALYQIRGRVGRSDKQAYAYITYKKEKVLSEVADKRLKAIKEFTEFGSGFKIAMRDLEIRGAGSLLGEIQSGHLEQVGYDTYCSLLDEVIREMRGEKIEPDLDIQIDLNVTSYIPESYIQDSAQKIDVYQNIALCKNEQDIQNVVDEIIDRFGNMPSELENLLDIARIKFMAKKLYITKISSKKSAVVFTFDEKSFSIDIPNLVKIYKNRIKFSPGVKPMVTLEIKTFNEKEILKEVIDFLSKLNKEEVICK